MSTDNWSELIELGTRQVGDWERLWPSLGRTNVRRF